MTTCTYVTYLTYLGRALQPTKTDPPALYVALAFHDKAHGRNYRARFKRKCLFNLFPYPKKQPNAFSNIVNSDRILHKHKKNFTRLILHSYKMNPFRIHCGNVQRVRLTLKLPTLS